MKGKIAQRYFYDRIPQIMGQPVGFTRHENESYGVEDGKCRPHHQDRLDFTLAGNRVDDTTEQDRLGDGDGRQYDIRDNDEGYAELVGAKIAQSPCIDLE